ncbi:hypothetical protein VaNZ11_013560, partial [Volvox africanus]
MAVAVFSTDQPRIFLSHAHATPKISFFRSNSIPINLGITVVSRTVHHLQGARPNAPSRASRQIVQAQCRYTGYPFKENDYLRVELLERPPYGPMKVLPATDDNAGYSGLLVFQREHEEALTVDTPIMEVYVAGDSACNIYAQLHGQKAHRPVVHDLMYNLLARAAEVHRGQWQLLRVAIVALDGDIFVGRLFFGDAATGTVHWDCDCRPSDGVYLSLRTQCPFYVARTVWEQAASPLRLSKVHMIAVHEDTMTKQQEQLQASQHHTQEHQNGASDSGTIASNGIYEHRRGGGGGTISPTAYEYMAIKPDDMDDIK